ncbi:MAG TPA: hypothetical protein VEO00_05965 [Actinomycetota bacterium]|nr:hypothetical protein [Actinomycetota bacterium]
MGRVIDLEAWREARETAARSGDPAVERLDRAMATLEARVEEGGRLSARHETDLLAITGAIALGMIEEAAERLERLAVRMAHPAGTGDRTG